MSALQAGHQLALLEGSDQLFAALIEAMDAARSEIRMESYILDVTGTGATVAEALVRAARRGVQVQLVVDGVGTGDLPLAWQRHFDDAGVQWRIFSPLGRWGLLNPTRWRRLHRKLCVVDATLAFCGGINILDDLHDPHHGPLPKPRFDFAVQIRGAVAADIHQTMAQLWWRLQAAQDVRERQLLAAWQSLRVSSRSPENAPALPVPLTPDKARGVRAALLLRDNLRHRRRIEQAYRRAIGAARHEVLIANAYFLPGGKMRKALMHAARRGVRVRLLLQGQYEYFMQYHAARPAYGALLAAGVEIHEYSASFLHAKVAVIDAEGARPWVTVGSSNLDPLSLLLAREANVVVEDRVFAQQLRARLVAAMATQGQPLVLAGFQSRHPWQRALDWIAYGLMRALLLVTGNRY